MNPKTYDYQEESVVYAMKDWTNNGFYNPLDERLVNQTSSTWVGGPTHHIKDQHIPGYTGHVHSLQSENLHGKPYAKLTNESLTGEVKKGFIIQEKDRFYTSYGDNFKNPKQQKQFYDGQTPPESYKSRYQTEIQLNSQFVAQDPKNVDPIDRLPVIGYQGYNPIFMNPLRKMKKLEEIKRKFDQGEIPQQPLNKVNDIGDLTVPAVGYTGFVQGTKAENVYGKTFQRTAMESLIGLKNKEPAPHLAYTKSV